MSSKSEYNKYRDKIKRYLKRMEQKGFIPTEDYSDIPTERQLRKQLTEWNKEHVRFAKEGTKEFIPDREQEEKRKKQVDDSVKRRMVALKRDIERLKKEQEFVNVETGEILSPEAIKQRTKLQKQIEKENERRFWSNEPQIKADADTYVPDGGEVIFNNIVQEVMVKLMSPTENEIPNTYSKRKGYRSNETVQRVAQAKSALLTLLQQAVDEKGASAVGWALDEYENLDADLEALNYGYNESDVNGAYMRIAEAIKGAPLSFEENARLTDESTNEEWYEEPD